MRRVAVLLLALGLAVLSGCSSPAPLAGGSARTEAVELDNGSGLLVGTLVVPELAPGERVPLAILMHGYQSFRDEPHLVRTAEQLQAAGIASLRMDFTGQGLSDGEVGSLGDMAVVELADSQIIYDYAAGLDFVDGISIVGYSLGGLVAAAFAGDHEVNALVLLAPAPTYGVYVPVLDSAAAFDGPVLILQGDSDDVVPMRVAEQYRDAFPNAELQVLEHENHNFTYGTPVEQFTVDFLTRHG